MNSPRLSIGILLYGLNQQARDAASEDKYRLLVDKMRERGWEVRTLAYHDACREAVRQEAVGCDAVLAWINPAEPQLDRNALDAFLSELASADVYVSAHPDTIMKIGTKDVLVATQGIGWSVDAVGYGSVAEFRDQLPVTVGRSGTRVLKQYRGHSGQGVWKVAARSSVTFDVKPAAGGEPSRELDMEGLCAFFDERVFATGSHLVDQAWVGTMDRGMVRAYLCGARVAGFGFQEIVALHPSGPAADFTRRQPSRRHYYTEDCFLFRRLRERLENEWVPALLATTGLDADSLPLLWDTDFFFGDSSEAEFLLCEINASCVSPFPESAITPMLNELERRLGARSRA